VIKYFVADSLKSYHCTDDRWPIFGCKNYDTFLEQNLVKGLFHSAVPEDVKKDYETIEYLIAHAWYHYPMYDGAVNKMLRTVEMAVSLKAKALNIPTETVDKKGRSKKIELVHLIRSIRDKGEDNKTKLFLDYLREMRNYFMHPEQHAFAGPVHREKMVLGINVINILFGESAIFQRFENRQNELRPAFNSFQAKTLGFQKGEKPYLAHQVSLVEVFNNEETEILLICIDPVGVFPSETKPQQMWIKPFFIDLVNYGISADTITGTDAITGEQISISVNTHPKDRETAETFRNKIHRITLPGSELDFPEAQYNPQLTYRMHEIGTELQRFRHRHYHKLGATKSRSTALVESK
jgi:hypothetical protein